MSSSSVRGRRETGTGSGAAPSGDDAATWGSATFPYVILLKAWEKAFEYRKLAMTSDDPAVAYAAPVTTRVERKPHAPTFREIAATAIDMYRPTWRNSKSIAKWEAALHDYAYPVIGDMRVDETGTGDVLRVLEPIWNAKREMAQRTKQRIATVMGMTSAAGCRRDNPGGDTVSAARPRGLQTQRH